MRHETVIPLIGGVAIASEKVFGTPPEKIYSYKPFAANDSHLVNYYKQRNLDIPYIDIEEMPWKDNLRAEVISTVCPCAGLSTLNHHASADNPTNDWMVKTAELVLGEMKPQVFWGENAPTFAGDRGKIVRKRLYEIGRKNGYTMSVYKTKSLDHGLPQYRGRAFYFFWKEKNKVPVFKYFKRELKPIEQLLDEVKGNFQRELTNESLPTDNMYYKYLLEEMYPGMTHESFIREVLPQSRDVLQHINLVEKVSFPTLAKYFDKIGNEKEADRNRRRQAKLDAGKGNMIRTIYLPKISTGAFVGYMPSHMTHYKENRFLSYRECMSIMGLPEDFELLEPKKSLNHICQNVPVTTAADMVSQIDDYLNGRSIMVENVKMVFQSNERKKMEIWEKDTATLENMFT